MSVIMILRCINCRRLRADHAPDGECQASSHWPGDYWDPQPEEAS
jgi:hypothetical protein